MNYKKQYAYKCIAMIAFVMFLMNASIFALYHGIIDFKLTPVRIYIGSIILFVFLFAFTEILFNPPEDNPEIKSIAFGNIEKPIIRYLLIGLFVLFFAAIFEMLFKRQFTEAEFCYEVGNFHKLPMNLWKVAFVLIFLSSLYLLISKKDISTIGRKGAYVSSCLITLSTNIMLNPYAGNLQNSGYFGDILRSTYISETIYNVYDGVPFDYDTTGLYGHYGLFFLIPMKIFGNKKNLFFIIAIIFVLIALIQQVALIYIVDSFVKKNWMAALLVIGGVIRWSSYAPTVFPFRSLFLMLFFAYYVYLYKRNKSIFSLKYRIISVVLIGLSILWNFEIGCVCMGGYVAYEMGGIIFDIRTIKSKISEILMMIVSCVASLIFAEVIMNIYNIICGTNFGLEVFFYPIISVGEKSENIIEFVNKAYGKPMIGNHAWEYVIVFFLALICYAWYEKKVKAEKPDDEFAGLVVAVSVMGIVAMVYYMNESLWNCMMLFKQTLFGLFGVVIYKLTEDSNNGIKLDLRFVVKDTNSVMRTGIIVSLLMVICFNAMQLINDPIKLSVHKENHFFDKTHWRNEIEYIDDNLPNDVFGVGQGINIMYHMMGRDNHSKLRDTSAWKLSNNSTYEKGIAEILEHEAFITCTSMVEGVDNAYDMDILSTVLERDSSYWFVREYKVGNATYAYYRRCKKTDIVD